MGYAPLNKLEIYEEFWNPVLLDFHTATVAGVGATTAAVPGTQAVIGNSTTISQAPRAGILSLQTGTTTTGTAGLYTGGNPILLGNNRFEYRTGIYIPTLANGTDDFVIRAGLGSALLVSDPVAGIYFRNKNTGTANVWELVCRSASTETAVLVSTSTTLLSSLATPTAGQWYDLHFIVNQQGNRVDFYITNVGNSTSYSQEVYVGSVTTNIPNVTGQEVGTSIGIQKNALGTNNRQINVDYILAGFDSVVPRF